MFYKYLIIYLAISLITIIILSYVHLFTHEIENVKVEKSGLKFTSNRTHKIKMHGAKMLKIDNDIYLKKDGRKVIIRNVKLIVIHKDYLHFKSLGETKIQLDLSNIYRYFNIAIKAKNFEIEKERIRAINSMLDNIFEPITDEVRRYLKLIKDILNINISDKQIVVKKNNYGLHFLLRYKLNGRIKNLEI